MIMSEKEYIQNYCPKADKYFYWSLSVKAQRIVRLLAYYDMEYDFINSSRGSHWVDTSLGSLKFSSWQDIVSWINETQIY